MSRRDHIDALTRELENYGATHVRVEQGGKHHRLVFTHDGKERFYVVPGTPSDRRGTLNALADIRHILGVRRTLAKSGRPKRRKPRARSEPMEDLTLTVKPDPFACLPNLLDPDRKYRERLRERANLAVYRLSFFKGSYRQWLKTL
ncbi:MAG: type II toxin-antitoxin system HicA family toxin [Geminicoccaceae bacterium]